MNKDEFAKLAAEVIQKNIKEMKNKMSPEGILAVSLVMASFSHDLTEALFDSEDSIEIESDNS